MARWASTPVAEEPVLLAGWRDAIDPHTVMVSDADDCDYVCPDGHRPGVSPMVFLLNGCRACKSNETRRAAANTLARTLPEIASTWHPTRNGSTTPRDVQATSKRVMWWLDPRCGHEWQEKVCDRNKYARLRCPNCKEILDSLAWEFPEIAAQWSSDNPLSAWMVRPKAKLEFTPEWLCPNDPSHLWRTPTATRVNGGHCPECKTTGKSMIELEHFEETTRRFRSTASGALLRDPAFTRRSAWSADILVRDALPGRDLVIEYDGAYWHSDKVLLDTEKSQDLLRSGHFVARLREIPLPSLGISDACYIEVPVVSSSPNPPAALDAVLAWMALHGTTTLAAVKG